MLLPAILYGTERKTSSMSEAQLIKTAILYGFSGIDSAAISGYAEKDAGTAIRESKLERDNLWIQSKFTPAYYNDHGNSLWGLIYKPTISIHDQIINSFYWSLNALQTQYIDSYLLHCPADGMFKNITKKDVLIWKEFEILRNDGLIKQIGVADITVDALQQISESAKVKPAIVQEPGFYAVMLQYCLDNGIAYQAVQLMRHDEFLSHINITNIANFHNITNGQVVLKFAQLLGVTPVLGTTQEKHMLEVLSLNFELSDEEVHLILQLQPNSDLLFSIYHKLQNGELLTQQNIVNTIINSDTTKLDNDLEKVLKYIPKIDPSTLSYLLKNVSIDTIHYLNEHGARFDLLNKAEKEEIFSMHPGTLKDELESVISNWVEEKSAELTLDVLINEENNAVFQQVIQDLKNNTLSEYWIEEFRSHPATTFYSIVAKYPEVAMDLINIGVTTGNILEALSSLKDQSYFDNIMTIANMSDIQRNLPYILINKFNFNYSHHSDTTRSCSYIQYKLESFNSAAKQKEAINNFATCYSKENANLDMTFKCYDDYESDKNSMLVELIKRIISNDRIDQFQDLVNSDIDLARLDYRNIIEIISKFIDEGKIEWFQKLVEVGFNFATLTSFDISYIINHIINVNKIEWLQAFVEAKVIDLTELGPYNVDGIVHRALNTKQFEWIEALTNAKLDFSKAEEQDKLFIEQLEKCHSDAKCRDECFTQEADITYYNSECIGQFIFIDNEL